jgi:hypothetical protein
MERRDAPTDDKQAHQVALKKVFGDNIELVNCESIKNDAGKSLFCEMLIKSDQVPQMKYAPKDFTIVMEVDE